VRCSVAAFSSGHGWRGAHQVSDRAVSLSLIWAAVSLDQNLLTIGMDLAAFFAWPAPPLTDNSEKKNFFFEDSPGNASAPHS
jgi:hypothetical protein